MTCVIYYPLKPSVIWVRLPYSPDNREWVRNAAFPGPGRAHTAWNPEKVAWALDRKYFARMVAVCVARFGEVTILQDNKISHRKQCDTRCVNALGPDCVCSCGGMNHRGTMAGYILVGDTVLIRSTSEISTTCRVIRAFEFAEL